MGVAIGQALGEVDDHLPLAIHELESLLVIGSVFAWTSPTNACSQFRGDVVVVRVGRVALPRF